MCAVAIVWICLRLCCGPGEDQFRAIAFIMTTIWVLYMLKSYTSNEAMGCEFEVGVALAAKSDAGGKD